MPPLSQISLPAGPDTVPLGSTPQPISKIDVIIDRRVPGGINTLGTADTVTLEVWCQLASGWFNLGGIIAHGGTLVTKGVTLATEEWSPAFAHPIPTGTPVELRTNSTAPVVIGGGSSTFTFS